MDSVVVEVVLPPLVVFLFLASITGMVAGALMIVRPDWLGAAGLHLNRWVATRSLEQVLERSVDLDRWFYRHHQAAGLSMLAGACWIIYFFIVAFDKYRMLGPLARAAGLARRAMEGLLDGVVLLGLAGAVFAALVSLFLLLRPSLLREFEHGANQWVSTSRAQEVLDVPREGAERYVVRHYRLFGLLLMLGSLFMLGMLAFWYG